jgi:hypothetical protein
MASIGSQLFAVIVSSASAVLKASFKQFDLLGVIIIAGVSIFSARLLAKTGVLLASILAGVSGFLWLYFTAEKTR